jgi:hypothetical protein
MATDNTQRDINDLMNAAQKKLAAQKEIEEKEKSQQSSSQPTDVYAGLFNDDEERTDRNRPDFDVPNPSIKHMPDNYANEEQPPQYDEHMYDDAPQDLGDLEENEMTVFEGGPSMAQVALWKKQFTRESVLHVKILSRHFIFRTLNRFEYKQVVSIENVDALYREELICRTCVLWPYNYDFKQMALDDSGYPSTLAEIIMESSGFTKEYGIEVL